MNLFKMSKLCVKAVLFGISIASAVPTLIIDWAVNPLSARVVDSETGRNEAILLHFNPSRTLFHALYKFNGDVRRIEFYDVATHECLLRANAVGSLGVQFGPANIRVLVNFPGLTDMRTSLHSASIPVVVRERVPALLYTFFYTPTLI
jgi:hypothetical protein